MLPERGLAIGVFDLFHVGHLRYLQYAARRCRHLVVAVSQDRIASEVKGRRPVIPEAQRLEIAKGLGFVAEARLQPTSTENTAESAEWIADWSIQHVIAGGSWQGSERWNRLVAALAGARRLHRALPAARDDRWRLSPADGGVTRRAAMMKGHIC